jgi:predicted nucleic acid-binding protein
VILYLDTSSLVKIYINETGTPEVLSLLEQATLVATSQVAYPEARAAFARRRREGVLRPRDFTTSKRAFEADWPSYAAVEATPALCHEAGDLAERYRLRGFDSIHLASFQEIVRSAGTTEVVFSSFDDRLNRAARALSRRRSRPKPSAGRG